MNIMYNNFSPRMNGVVRTEHSQLTEANLRLHTSSSIKVISSRQEWLPGHHADEYTQRFNACETGAPMWGKSAEAYPCYDDLDESDDEDITMPRNHVALRRAASLQALKAYGGCFASGFLAMQEPLPAIPRKWSCTTDAESLDLEKLASEMSLQEMNSMKPGLSSRQDRAGSPRPDSDTLSQVDMSDVKHERRWRWRGMGKRRRNSAK